MNKRIDLTGKTFGELFVACFYSSDGRHVKWKCNCSCGSECIVTTTNLRREHSTKCRSHPRVSEHKRDHPLYQVWREMLRRCTDEKSTSFKNYGAKGITVCDEWLEFDRFVSDVGDRPEGTSLDRKDNKIGYSKQNCRWATPVEQARNVSGPRIGVDKASKIKQMLNNKMTIKSISELTGVSKYGVFDIKRGRTWIDVQPSSDAPDGVQPELM